tara:strand:+ start:7311 stop:8387 length:1077 start_codon:yes stop_codon:yes gene_type:complete
MILGFCSRVLDNMARTFKDRDKLIMIMFFLRTLFLFVFVSQPSLAEVLDKRKVCTWDPVGRQGPVMAFFTDLEAIAIPWGLDLEFIPYEDENQVAKDLSKGECDIGIVTAILSRDFVQFAGTLDAIGGITSEDKLKKTLATITSPKATDLMSDGNYEVVASLPVGSMYAYVNDKSIDSIDKFRGKKIGILNGDIQTQMFAELAGATPFQTSLSEFASHFNEGHIDITFMPALAYETFELNKGLGDKGGILDIRLFYGMIQAISRKSEFSDTFGVQMRRYLYNKLATAIHLIDNAEASIPKKYWIETSQETKDELEEFYKNIRLTLKVNKKFDSRALSLLWKIRCQSSPERDECVKPEQ